MANKERLEVQIPDHEVLRKIGGGAYGEVWLARGVTGAWRAVKVVWREDFEDERGFEREFEGILKYEPLSRDHPGLVNILHVGRSNEDFYYYVMELGDDVRTGAEIHPVEYEARTLLSDLVEADGSPIDVDFCLEVAARLAEALAYLHDGDLAHRDVKPSNVIFVGGNAKLADIGLVAPRDQRTFVGTEGFVPPEGPGSAQADLYSLGKVLYEMMTGKDRLQFPELPDALPDHEKRKLWLDMNQLICDICEPKLAKRTITSAAEFARLVRLIQQGKKLRRVRRTKLSIVVTGVFALCVVAFGGYYVSAWKQFSKEQIQVISDVEDGALSSLPRHEFSAVKVNTLPPQAQVYENGVLLDEVTPIGFKDFKPGEEVVYRFELAGYKTVEQRYVIPDQKTFFINKELEIYKPPLDHLIWVGPLGVEYFPREGYHIAGFLQFKDYVPYQQSAKNGSVKELMFSENGEDVSIVLLTEKQAQNYGVWLEKLAREEGLIRENQMMRFEQDSDLVVTGFTEQDKQQGRLPTRYLVEDIDYGSILVTSNPTGARVFLNGEYAGMTPLPINQIRPQTVVIEVRAEGFRKERSQLVVDPGGRANLVFELDANDGLVFGQPWKNSLQVPVVPIREGLMASVWEVRVKDYQQFVQETQHRVPREVHFDQSPDDPVVGVDLADAKAFCTWLTYKEREEERITESQFYKVPSDLEWSQLVGIRDDPQASPAERDYQAHQNAFSDPRLIRFRYFWGAVFPPRDATVNIADQSAATALEIPQSRVVDDYFDGYPKTAPVGSFPSAQNGLFDLCGNVYEWVDTKYDSSSNLSVVRGGSWATFTKGHLHPWSRLLVPSTKLDHQFGFRVVLVEESP